MALYAAGIVAALAVMFVTQMWEYRGTYTVVYQESARKRISIAERLRLLPLSFFGKARFGRLDERYHEGLLRSGAPVLAHYAANFRYGRFDAGVRCS